MTTEEKKEMERLREEVDRLTKMNVSLATASERLMAINNEIYKRLDSYYNVRMRVD